jgi:hypothetical protein
MARRGALSQKCVSRKIMRALFCVEILRQSAIYGLNYHELWVFTGVRCLACSGIHLVSRVTGRLAADKGE